MIVLGYALGRHNFSVNGDLQTCRLYIWPALPPFLRAYPQLKIVVSISDDSRTDIVQQGIIDLVKDEARTPEYG